jgi:hypothetical protein
MPKIESKGFLEDSNYIETLKYAVKKLEEEKKMSEKAKGRNTWSKGRKHSKETCKKRSISIQKWWDERRKVC